MPKTNLFGVEVTWSATRSVWLQIMKKLYREPVKKWNAKLRAISHENTILHGRENIGYDIYYNNRVWSPLHLHLPMKDENKLVLPIKETSKDLMMRMEIIGMEIEALEDEMFEVKNYLSTILTFRVNPEVFKSILGDTIYGFCDNLWDALEVNHSINTETALYSYVKTQRLPLNLMHQRLLMNLIEPNA